jgi:hypothetical protein
MGLLKMELPTGTITLSDGGFLIWGSDLYLAKHTLFGSIGSVAAMSEGTGQMVPALELTFFPSAAATPADLSQPGFQKSRVRLWLAEYSADTGLVVGTPDLLFDGQVDQTEITEGTDNREVAMTVVANAERLFEGNLGNSLNATFHKAVWPGETGQDQATGLTLPIAWGVESPRAAGTSYGLGVQGLINSIGGVRGLLP